jgi:hypothetical protein
MADFFSSLLAPFSTSAQDAAAQAQQQALQNAYSLYSGLNQSGLNFLQNAYGAGIGDINQYFPQAQQALQTNYTAGLAPVQQNVANAQAGIQQLFNALGIGPQGNAGMLATLQATPGYQFALDQGNQNVLRNQAATGQLTSGGTNADLLKFGQGLAEQTYNNYISQLQPFLGYGTSAAGQALQGYGNLGTGLANSLQGQGTGLSGLNTALGQNVLGALQNQGAAAYGTQAGIGNAQANAALAPLMAGQNAWNLLGNIAKLGVGAATGGAAGAGGTLGGNFLSGLGSNIASGANSLYGQFNTAMNPAYGGYNVTGGVQYG